MSHSKKCQIFKYLELVKLLVRLNSNITCVGYIYVYIFCQIEEQKKLVYKKKFIVENNIL